ITKTAGGTMMNSQSIAPTPAAPACVNDPATGLPVGQGGTDTAGRPMAPSLFITDITGTDPCTTQSTGCQDWQCGTIPPTPIPPDGVCGTWKGAVKTINTTKIPTTITVTPDGDPAKNNYNLGMGSDPVPPGLVNQGFGAEVRWNVDDLIAAGTLQSGHSYRFQFMVHDGDQNKTGGDGEQRCVTGVVPWGPPGARRRGGGVGRPPPAAILRLSDQYQIKSVAWRVPLETGVARRPWHCPSPCHVKK